MGRSQDAEGFRIADTDAFARFRIEAKVAARLQHPNIVHIHDVGELDNNPYLVFEYLDASSLKHVQDGNPQPAGPPLESLKFSHPPLTTHTHTASFTAI